MSTRVLVRTLVVVALALLAQTTVLLDVRIGSAVPDVMLLLPVAAGVVAGPVAGGVVGFVAGLAADLVMPTPFGLGGLVGTLLGFAAGSVSAGVGRDVRGFATLVALVGSAAGVMLYAVLGAVLGEAQFLHVGLGTVVAVVAVVNAVLAGPAVRALRWALSPPARAVAGGRR